MRIDAAGPEFIRITLSRRNLLYLLGLAEGQYGDSDWSLRRWQDWEAPRLEVCVEPDAVHYADRDPGAMPSSAERWIEEHG